MTLLCKHGLPTTLDLGDWQRDEHTLSYKQTATVTMCKKCIEEGAAQQVAQMIDRVVRANKRL